MQKGWSRIYKINVPSELSRNFKVGVAVEYVSIMEHIPCISWLEIKKEG